MSNVLEVSYTGDILSHRRCPRAWAYERHVGLHPYEQVQAMEGLLAHYSMEWLTGYFRKHGRHANAQELADQITRRYFILRSRGIRSKFVKKVDLVARVTAVFFPAGVSTDAVAVPTYDSSAPLDAVLQKCVECALHAEYEIKSVHPLSKGIYPGKEKYLLRGVLDLVTQEKGSMAYEKQFQIQSVSNLDGSVQSAENVTKPGEIEIWDYKATQPTTPYVSDYVRQLLSYAAIYHQHTGQVPDRCVLAFLRRPKSGKMQGNLIVIPIDKQLLIAALSWTEGQIRAICSTVRSFQKSPSTVAVGLGGCGVIDAQLKSQCTACGQRFDCTTYAKVAKADCDVWRIDKN